MAVLDKHGKCTHYVVYRRVYRGWRRPYVWEYYRELPELSERWKTFFSGRDYFQLRKIKH